MTKSDQDSPTEKELLSTIDYILGYTSGFYGKPKDSHKVFDPELDALGDKIVQ